MPLYIVKLHKIKFPPGKFCRRAAELLSSCVCSGQAVDGHILEATSSASAGSGSKLWRESPTVSSQKRPSAIMVEERNGHDNALIPSQPQQCRLPLASLPDGALGLLLSFGSVADLISANMVS